MSTQTDTFLLGGGLDLTTPSLAKKPGFASEALNFEPGIGGGYRRIDGYERFSGRPSPSRQDYSAIKLTSIAGLVLGQTVTGVTSGATGRLVGIDGLAIGLTAITGTFIDGESVGSGRLIDELAGVVPDSVDVAWRKVAQDYYRSLIAAVPGSGRILGVIWHETYAIAFRNNVGNTAAVAYKSTATGWVAMTFGHVVRFKTGTAVFEVGQTVTTATGSGVIKKVTVYNGATGTSDASGYLVLSGFTGTMTNTQALQVAAVTKAVCDGAASAVAFQPGGSFQFAQHNFYAGSGTFNLYGCDGINPAWEWDGVTMSPILMPNLVDAPFANNPSLIVAHRGHLFLAFDGGSVQHSVVGEPLLFSGFLGAEEFGMGAEVTGLSSQAGDVLLIYTRRSTYGLYGAGISDWSLKPVAPEVGAIFGTIQLVGYNIGLDDRGLTQIQRAQQYGNFGSSTISKSVQPILNGQKGSVTASGVVRKSSQYRLYFESGQFLIAYLAGAESAPEFMVGQYPIPVRCMSGTENATGDEITLFGSDDGYVYQDGMGNSLDGESMRYLLRLPFNHAKSSRIRKRYRGGQVDLEADGAASIYVSGEIDYGSPDTLQPEAVLTGAIFGGGGYYDTDSWDEIYWDAQVVSNARFELDGVGVNVSLSFLGESAVTAPFTLQSIQIDYDLRRRER